MAYLPGTLAIIKGIINKNILLLMKGIMCKCSEKWQDYAPLVLRIVVGLSFFMHGWQKMQGDNAVGFFGQIGIPAAGFFGPLVTYLELLGGAALILGLWTHWASKLLAIDMIVAILAVHMGKGYFVSGGGPELVLLLLGGCISLMITGAGRFSLDYKWMR